jgi:hypothetical protein
VASVHGVLQGEEMQAGKLTTTPMYMSEQHLGQFTKMLDTTRLVGCLTSDMGSSTSLSKVGVVFSSTSSITIWVEFCGGKRQGTRSGAVC